MSARLVPALLTTIALLSIPEGWRGTLEASESARAQSRDKERQTLVVVIVETPLLLLPDANREPLPMLEVGTALRLLDQDADWFHTEYQDFHYGRRVGYVQKKDAVAVEVDDRVNDPGVRSSSRR